MIDSLWNKLKYRKRNCWTCLIFLGMYVTIVGILKYSFRKFPYKSDWWGPDLMILLSLVILIVWTAVSSAISVWTKNRIVSHFQTGTQFSTLKIYDRENGEADQGISKFTVQPEDVRSSDGEM
jgi:hypothetical protein